MVSDSPGDAGSTASRARCVAEMDAPVGTFIVGAGMAWGASCSVCACARPVAQTRNAAPVTKPTRECQSFTRHIIARSDHGCTRVQGPVRREERSGLNAVDTER